MGIVSKFLSSPIVDTVDALGNAADKLITSDEERLQADAFLKMVKQKPYVMQAEINKINARYRGFFDNGWRSAVGWIAALGLSIDWIVRPILSTFGHKLYDVNSSDQVTLLSALLGIGAIDVIKELREMKQKK